MPTSTNSIEEITIRIDSEAARAFKTAAPELQKKIQLLFSAWLIEITSKNRTSLKLLMDEISEKAQDRGLTPEILETILREE